MGSICTLVKPKNLCGSMVMLGWLFFCLKVGLHVCVEMNMGACVQLIRGGSGKHTRLGVFYVCTGIMWRF